METQDITTRTPYQPRPGAPFAGYTLGELIGWGGCASVYRLPDMLPDAHSARCIKIGSGPDPTGQRADRAAKQGYRAGARVYMTGVDYIGGIPSDAIGAIIMAEYRLLREHPMALLPVVETAGTDHDLPYYVMEYLGGQTLRAALVPAQATDRLALLQGFAQLVATLGAAQSGDAAFIHGDLKPENIIVTPDHWRLIDPVPRSENGSNDLGLDCGAGTISTVGTRAYNPTLHFGRQSDLRALAIILFEIVAGWQPFMDLSPRWGNGAMPGPHHREMENCLETERCRHSAREPFFQQLLWWMRDPPTYPTLEAFVRAHPHGPYLATDSGARTLSQPDAQGRQIGTMTADLSASFFPQAPPLTQVPVVDIWMEGDYPALLLAHPSEACDLECIVRRFTEIGHCAYLLLDPLNDPDERREQPSRPLVLVGVRNRHTLVTLPYSSLALLQHRIAANPEDHDAESDRFRVRFAERGVPETFSRVKQAERELRAGLTAKLVWHARWDRDATSLGPVAPGTRLAITDWRRHGNATVLSLRDPASGTLQHMDLIWVVSLGDRMYAVLRHQRWFEDVPTGMVVESVALRVADTGTLVVLAADEMETIRIPIARAARTFDRSPPDVVDAAFDRSA